MSTPDSPAKILHTFLVNEGIFETPDDVDTEWPLFIGQLPDGSNVPSNCAAIYNTVGIKDGRLMTGALVMHPGLQVIVRSIDPEAAYTKAMEVQDALEAITAGSSVVVGATTYKIWNVSQDGPAFPLQVEGDKRWTRYSLNYLATLNVEEGSLVVCPCAFETVDHTADGNVTAAQMVGHLHTNVGSGGTARLLNLPDAAAGLYAHFVQVDEGTITLNPKNTDTVKGPFGAMTAGQALVMSYSVSGFLIMGRDDGTWLVLFPFGNVNPE